MKVFQINTVCGVGSTGRIATDLYHVLKKEGHSCCIAYGRGKAPADVDSYKIDSMADVYLHTFFSRLTDGEGLFSEGVTRKLLKKIQGYDPDIIHLHNIHGHYLNYPILFHFLKNIINQSYGHFTTAGPLQATVPILIMWVASCGRKDAMIVLS